MIKMGEKTLKQDKLRVDEDPVSHHEAGQRSGGRCRQDHCGIYYQPGPQQRRVQGWQVKWL